MPPRGSRVARPLQAYKKLAVKYPPDKNPDNKEMAEENFKKVSEAYEVLSNSEKRQTYDTVGKAGLGGGGGMPGGNFSQADAEAMFSQVFGGQDPFSVLFGEMGGGRGMGRGAGGPGMQFHFGGMPGGMGGMGGMPGPSGMGGGMGGMGAQSELERLRAENAALRAARGMRDEL